MMLNYAEIDLLLRELEPWRGAVVQKVQQSRPEELTLGLRRRGETGWLSLALTRGHLRFHLLTRKLPAMQRAPGFTMALRKHLPGRQLTGWSQPPGERIARFHFAGPDGEKVLIAELIPPGGNLILTDAAGLVLARLFTDERNATVGRPYKAPAPPPGQMLHASAPAIREWSGPSFHAALENEYAPLTDTVAREHRVRHERLYAKREKLLRKLDEDWLRAGNPATWRLYGDLLSNAPGAETKGLSELVLRDDAGNPHPLPLHPALSRQEHIDKFYKRARRADSARRHIAERRRQLDSDAPTEFSRPRAAPASGSAARPNAAPATNVPADLPPGHIFQFPGGSLILVGRSAKENDRITFGWARGEDYWLHARDVPGAHTVVRHLPGDELGDILDAAGALALHYSSRRGEPSGDVHVTRKKYLQRVKGAQGKVRIIREENRRVQIDPETLAGYENRRIKRQTG